MPRFSAHLTQLFTERPFAERFAAAAAHGFVACEFRSPFEHRASDVAAWSRDAALPIVLFNAPAGDWSGGERGLAALPGREADFREATDRAVRYADALDVPMVHVMAGNVAAPTPEHRRTFVDNLRLAARAFAPSGRTLTIEAINPHDMPGYYLSTQAQAHAIRDEVDEPNLFVQMDCYHAARTEGDVATILRERIATIRHVQIAGVPDRHEPEIGIDDQGGFDYAPIFALLDTLPYDGWVGCEYRPLTTTEAGLGWMESAASRASMHRSPGTVDPAAPHRVERR